MNPIGVFNWLIFLLFYSSLPIFVYLNGNFNYYWDTLETILSEDETATVHDFIVVGGGSSGGVIANRLSKNNKVLLVEAGGDPLYLNSIPGLAPNMIGQPAVDWNYYTVSQEYSSFSMNDQRSFWPRGKALGGSSVLNFMLYVRGHPLDYDLWANITGSDDWKYENLLEYFKKSLDYHGDFTSNEKHYSSGPYGYLHVEKQHHKPLHPHFVNAGVELGFPIVDANGPQTSGFSVQEVTQKNGKRFSINDAFLKSARNRKNLRISKYSLAYKIQLDNQNRAVGVWYTKNGKKKFARASKEVIVSCGAVDSPKLLMLSGIGPKKHLKSLKIPVKVNLPVGKFLKDHIAVYVPFQINDTVSMIPERDFGFKTLWDYYVNGKGSLTNPADAYSHAFFSTSLVSKNGIDWPDIQLYILSLGVSQSMAKDFSMGYNFKPGVYEAIFDPIIGKDMFMLMPTLARPKSFGDLKLASRNPAQPPLINPNYLKNDDDVKTLLEAIKFSLKLGEETKSFQKLGATLVNMKVKGCEQHMMRSNEFWECYIRHHGRTMYHPIGTCRMGKNVSDPNAVVDPQLKVLGVKGLRVADASIMPELINGNTNAPCVMIGERAADFIRSYWAKHFLVCIYDFLDIVGKFRTCRNNELCCYSHLI